MTLEWLLYYKIYEQNMKSGKERALKNEAKSPCKID